MLTVFEDHERIFQSLAAGASGYLLKSTPPARLLEAICEVHQGGAPMSAQIARSVVEAFQKPAPTEPAPNNLTPREQEILRAIARGASNKEIGRELGIAETTVKIHVQHVLRKLDVSSRVQAAVIASEHGLV